MPVAMVEAVVLGRRNEQRNEKYQKRRKKLERHLKQENAAQDETRTAVYEEALVPFRQVFERLKRVDLAELAPVGDASSEPAVADVELRALQDAAVAAVASVAAGAVAGAGVGAVTFAAVGAFATASTGAAISGLSGAAATSATLAWLGGGSLAAGGGGVAAGTMVLTAAIAAPALLVTGVLLEWRGRTVREEQQKVAKQIEEAEAALTEARAVLSPVFRRSRELRLLLKELARAMAARQGLFAETVDRCDDYAVYGLGERVLVKEMFDLAVAMVTVLGTPPAGEDGHVSEVSGRVIGEVRAKLDALGAAA
ncbi:hypothetical protein LG634_23040 [Streptomyces bambusae]|uniref:hypothetical protein n=1 Tax=Streptomyces bambusae TaxID=1550616 RepID=UPI001CFD099B|nr:hypothetical protein [Streptomyces bambusae]MCB5167694.1 hypothetical protein [Streptomyces bambusae]